MNLRLRPDVMDLLYSLSTVMSDKPGTGLAYAKVVEAALAALDREMSAEVERDAERTRRGRA